MVGSGRKCANSGVNNAKGIGRSTTIQSNQYGIPDDHFNQHHCGLFCVAQIWYISFLTPLPHKSNISAIVTNKVTLYNRKNSLCNGIQYNTSHFRSYGFQNIPNFLWGFYYVIAHLVTCKFVIRVHKLS